jgi:hypothetical protein
MIEKEDAISQLQAAKQAFVTKNAIFAWAAEGLLEIDEIAGHRVYSKQQLNQLLEVRAKNPRNWKHLWREEYARRKEKTRNTSA